MKITVISGCLYPSSEQFYGSEHMSANLADGLGQIGHNVVLFAPPQSQRGKYKLIHVPCTYGKILYQAESIPYDEYRQLLLDSDVIFDRSPTMVTAEQLWFFEDRDWVERRVIGYSSGGWSGPRPPVRSKLHFIAVSNIHKQHGIESGLKPEQISVIPYGIDTELYSPDYASKGDSGPALYLGAPRLEKGIITILDIAECLPEQNFILAWHVFSDVHREADRKFKEELARRKLPNVRYQELSEGRKGLEEKVKLYQRAKCFLQPSAKEYKEFLGLTTLEALSCGTPVIRECWGSSPEIIQQGVHGFLCNELNDYVEAIKKVAKIDPRECRRLIERRYYKRRYATDHLKLWRTLSEPR